MARLRATYDYAVRRLIISRDLLGVSVPLESEGYDVELVFPVRSTQPEAIPRTEVESDLFPPDDPPFPMQEGGGYIKTGIRVPPSDEWASIGFLRVHVYAKGDPDQEGAMTALGEGEEVADAFVARVVEWLRVEARHPWLAVGGEPPEGVGTATIADLDAHELLPATLGRERPVLRRVKGSEIVRKEALSEILRRVESGEEPTLADSLLADAIFYSEAEPADTARAVLTAAIACEIKVRDVLRERVDPAADELLDVLLSNPRDWSLSAASLFHKPMQAVVGRSLKDKDADPPLKDVVRLFELRNDVAHRGRRPTQKEADAALKTAVKAFRWLQQV